MYHYKKLPPYSATLIPFGPLHVTSDLSLEYVCDEQVVVLTFAQREGELGKEVACVLCPLTYLLDVPVNCPRAKV